VLLLLIEYWLLNTNYQKPVALSVGSTTPIITIAEKDLLDGVVLKMMYHLTVLLLPPLSAIISLKVCNVFLALMLAQKL
jgi:hypothetical protein